jgi:hypothetical protein
MPPLVPALLTLLALVSGLLRAAGQDADTLPPARPWTPPDSRLGIRTAPILLLTRGDVQADLELSAEVAQSLDREVAGLHFRATRLRRRPDAEVIAERRAIDEDQRRWIETMLTQAQQKRLLQIDLQWEGPSAVVTRPWLANQIELSPEQRSRLARAVAQSQVGIGDATTGRGSETRLATEVLATLTPEQAERLGALLGQPLVVASDARRDLDPAVQKSSR